MQEFAIDNFMKNAMEKNENKESMAMTPHKLKCKTIFKKHILHRPPSCQILGRPKKECKLRNADKQTKQTRTGIAYTIPANVETSHSLRN